MIGGLRLLLDPVAGARNRSCGSAKSHFRSDIVHCEHIGCLSSHLIRRRLHSLQPNRDFLCFLRAIDGGNSATKL
ncbi:hypothetical protein BO99DRAFT_399826 [Aspergillus violaceofuscus CBS 115571]|uniref:Uncharacterized protein n=1 Tax=Aspergillus violaceofuscus (strain CBS 115571) TaxID=1450538 RepID=A0A2V5HMJ6_ASPV1|nr:hypothetical protein BO99DRAFT_399826 [Aspergillus violaceofuscus CBS 115571]